MDLKEFIRKILVKESTGKYLRGRCRYDYIQKHYPEYYKKLIERTSFLKKDEILLIRLWMVTNDLYEWPNCECGNKVKWHSGTKQFNNFCSHRCTHNIDHVQKSIKQKNLKKYNVDHHWLVPEIQKKRQKTLQSKYGKKGPLGNKKIRNSIKKKNIEKFGGPAPVCCPEIKKRIEQTNLERYGTRCTLNTDKARENLKKTLEVNRDLISKKIQNTWNSKTKQDQKAIVEKRKEASKQKYGVDNPSQRHINPKIINFRKNKPKYKKWLEIQHYKLKRTQLEIANILGVDSKLVNTSFKELGINTKYFYSSYLENKVFNYVKTLTNNVFQRDRSLGIELDLLINNVAIEVNGIYWHSSKEVFNNDRKNHQYKTKMCRESGIRLFHIIETQWNNPLINKIWKSIIKGNLVGHSRQIYARNTKIKVVMPGVAQNFYLNNHLQGKAPASLHLGLFYNNELVSCMSFYDKKNKKWELTRYASLLDTQVLGGASKLFKNFVKEYHPEEVITFADLNYSYGDIYYILGFKLVGEVSPSYWYTDKKRLIHKRNFQKKRLKKLLGDKFDPNKTEIENVLEHTKYRIYWDSGKLKFLWKTS